MTEQEPASTPTDAETSKTAEIAAEPELDDVVDCVDEEEAKETAQIKAELKEKELGHKP